MKSVYLFSILKKGEPNLGNLVLFYLSTSLQTIFFVVGLAGFGRLNRKFAGDPTREAATYNCPGMFISKYFIVLQYYIAQYNYYYSKIIVQEIRIQVEKLTVREDFIFEIYGHFLQRLSLCLVNCDAEGRPDGKLESLPFEGKLS